LKLWTSRWTVAVERRDNGTKHVNKQILRLAIVGTLIGTAPPLYAQDAQDGFYGGVSLRQGGADAVRLALGGPGLVWSRFVAPAAAEDAAQQTLLFGGYRWKSDVSVEAAFNSRDQYALKAGSDRPAGVGLGLVDTSTRTWNADVYTSWEFLHSFSLYGRLGYAQNDSHPLFSGASLVPGDPRRFRDGVNYGLGLRYILSQSLGLRVEYSRFGRFAGEKSSVGVLPESDQVTIGVQYRF
jgi:opacity protein-like surface antigen